jgi:hypothetical protein
MEIQICQLIFYVIKQAKQPKIYTKTPPVRTSLFNTCTRTDGSRGITALAPLPSSTNWTVNAAKDTISDCPAFVKQKIYDFDEDLALWLRNH